MRWLQLPDGATPESLNTPGQTMLAFDSDGRLVVLLADNWDERFFQDRNPGVKLLELPPNEPSLTAVTTDEAASS